MTEAELLSAAKEGDHDAYALLVDPHRPLLHAHCYRMLGSVPDAEDALQEALLRAWKGLPRFEGRSSLRSWLYTIATNACLKAIERRPKRVLPVDYGPPGDPHRDLDEPLVESVWLQPYPDERLVDVESSPDARYEQREAVEVAFVAALQLLPARQRAVLILRDVLGFSGAEVAETLDMSPAAVYSALQRAHKTVEERLPAQSQRATLASLDDEQLRSLATRYVDAWERSDVAALVELLTEDAIIAMPPYRTWYAGRDAVAVFLAKTPMIASGRWRVLPSSANGQLSFAHYLWNDEVRTYAFHGMEVLGVRDGKIAEIIAFLDPAGNAIFGLPATVDGPWTPGVA